MMKQFWTVFKFELMNYLKNKIFIGVILLGFILIAIVMFFPRISSALSNDNSKDQTERPTMLIAYDLNDNSEYVQQVFSNVFTDYNISIVNKDVDSIQSKITDGEAECAFVINSYKSYTYYVNDLSLYDSNTVIADEALKSIAQMNLMIEGGLSGEQASQILSTQIEHEVKYLGNDQMQSFFYTYIMIFALYMVILLYGQMIATSVASEKSSRAMELLITSVDPNATMFGKVIASCLAGLIQLVAIFGSAILLFSINKSYWSNNSIINSIFNMPLPLFFYMLLFFILGFFIYAFLYGAVGSTASKLEDINTSVLPITFLFIIGLIIVMMSMTGGNVDSILMKICSYVPFTSPMAMFTRIAMTTVPVYEIIISVAILLGSAIGIGVLSAKIYRVGVLLYGTSPKILDIIKMIWKA